MIVYYPIWFYFLPANSLIDCQFNEINNIQTPFELCSQNQLIVNQKVDWETFQKIFLQELKNKKNNKKSWKNQQDELLKKMVQEGKDWIQISQTISESNPEKCKRRFNRLKQQLKRWPKEIDEQIEFLHQQESLSWQAVASSINQKFKNKEKFNSKQVKQRYIFHLKPGISNESWTLEEDLMLLRLSHQKQKCWKQIAQSFHSRTELQLKNRYYGTLKFIQNRALRKLRQKTYQNM